MASRFLILRRFGPVPCLCSRDMLPNADDRRSRDMSEDSGRQRVSQSRIPVASLLVANDDDDHSMDPPEPIEPELSFQRQIYTHMRAEIPPDGEESVARLPGKSVSHGPCTSFRRNQDRVEDQPMPSVPWPGKEYHRRASAHASPSDMGQHFSLSCNLYHQQQPRHQHQWCQPQQPNQQQSQSCRHVSNESGNNFHYSRHAPTSEEKASSSKTFVVSDALERMDSGRDPFAQHHPSVQLVDNGDSSSGTPSRRISGSSGSVPATPMEIVRGAPVVSRQSSETEAFSTGWCWSDLTASDRSRSSLDVAMLLSPKQDIASSSTAQALPQSLPSIHVLQQAGSAGDAGHRRAEHLPGEHGYTAHLHHSSHLQVQGNLAEYESSNSQNYSLAALQRHAGHPSYASIWPAGAADADDVDSDDGLEDESGMPTVLNCRVEARAPRRRWKDWEDSLLRSVVAREGANHWNEIARHFPGRNGRQVRLRWMNHLQPSLDRAPWRQEEDEQLLSEQARVGNKWAQIAEKLGGRTDNAVKNRFKSLQRRAQREQRNARQAHPPHMR